MKFNPTVHETDEHGDGIRTAEGEFRLKTNWKSLAEDHKGRKYNEKVHGEPRLDDDGLLVVQRREAARKPMGATKKIEDFVNRHKEPGYSYRLVTDEGGRIETFRNHDWEVVQNDQGVAAMPIGQARDPGARGVLMRKPEEWYAEDQKEKARLRNMQLDKKTAPQEGQYAPDGVESKLR